MTDGPTVALVPILAILVLGAGLARRLGLGWRDGGAFCVWAHVLGALGAAIAVLAWLACARSLPGGILFAGLTATGLALAWRAPSPVPPRIPFAPAPAWERILLVVVVVLVVTTLSLEFAAVAHEPVCVGDEANIWALRASALFRHGPFSLAYREDVVGLAAGLDYPIMNSLLQTLVFTWASDLTAIANRVVIQVFALTLLVALASALGGWLRPSLVALGLLLVGQAPALAQAARSADADVLVGVGLLASVDAWMRWHRGAGRHWIVLAGLGAMFIALSKNEGAVLGLTFVIAVALAARWQRRAIPWCALLPPLLAVVWNASFNATHGFVNYLDALESPEALSVLERARLIAVYLGACLLDPARNLMLGAFLLCAALFGRSTPRLVLVPLAVALAMLAALVGVYLLTPQPLQWQLENSAARVLFQLVPLATLGLGVIASSLWPRVAGRATSVPTRSA